MISSGTSGGQAVGNDRQADSGGEYKNDRPADALGDFAADLGKFLGGVQSRATSWLDQRKAIAEQLTQIRDTANKYLEQLSGRQRVTTPSMLAKEVVKREGQGGLARPRRTMSAAARKRISDAQKARWAKQRGK